ncbi:hypothetical protein BC938DRAFT_480922 [Jimgerdemannia flammicorona]|uniref:HCP-like protein n=1 Tax=Jimgerdemannia flammicorona TaxID=994334 RepID=A0A433QI38_9FUNG|nr:hypothetical protein BC938DRAFT_480922 [Jimgerdemannia flammicorona]
MDHTKAKKFFLSSAEQGFPDAQAALGCRLVEEGNYDEGVIWLQRAIQKLPSSPCHLSNFNVTLHILQDNTRALLKLAIMHEEGDGVERNNDLAVLYYKAAANRDEPVAQYVLGMSYRLGQLGLRPNPQEALNYLRKSAESGYTAAQRLLGMMYDEGIGTARDYVTALGWFRKAAAQGDSVAMGLLGSYYECGYGVPKDPIRALDCYVISARDGSALAEYSAAQLLHRRKQYEEAYDWYSRAANHGRASAKFMVARYLLHGWGGIAKDEEKAFQIMLVLSDEDELAESHLWVGTCYEEGVGISKDLGKAFKYYLKSAESGDAEGQYQLGYMLSNGNGVERNRKKALAWYIKSAEQGNPAAQNSVGVYHLKGIETPRDTEKAREFFLKAASQHLPDAQTNLGILCASESDHKQAALWYLKAAKHDEQGTVTVIVMYYLRQHLTRLCCCFNFHPLGALKALGGIYEAGTVVQQSFESAYSFFQRAAAQGDIESVIRVANYYENGWGVAQDLDMALAHYLKASQSGDPGAYSIVSNLLVWILNYVFV